MDLNDTEKSLFINKRYMRNYEPIRRYMRGEYTLTTQEFSDGDFHEMGWVDYCFRYAHRGNRYEGPETYKVARYKEPTGHLMYTIVKKKEPQNDSESVE